MQSAAQQVEYWASLGRDGAGLLDPEQRLAVKAGLARLRVEPLRVAAVDPDIVVETVEEGRRRGSLASFVSTASIRYQASASHPGLLERISGDGPPPSAPLWMGCSAPPIPSPLERAPC